MTPRSVQRIAKDTRAKAPRARRQQNATSPARGASCLLARGARRLAPLFLGTTLRRAESNISQSAHRNRCGRLRLSAGFGYTPQSTKFPERFMSIADRVRRLLFVLLKRSAATVVIGAALVCGLSSHLAAQD